MHNHTRCRLRRTFGYLIVAVSRDGYFFEGLNILISTFCVCADGFQDLSKVIHYPIQLYFLFASLKLLTNFGLARVQRGLVRVQRGLVRVRRGLIKGAAWLSW